MSIYGFAASNDRTIGGEFMLEHVTTLLSLCMAIMLAGPVAAQQAYPSKPVRLIVPFPPGGANDIVARLSGQRLTDRWARVVVIDNRAGAGGRP
ncbi:MAG: hypothetical protein Q7R45_16025 [Sulfuricaulis sp.]|nr:hypothetical protein [Sulfuricaulis sp.]